MPWISKNRLKSLQYQIDTYKKRSDRMHRRAQEAEGDLVKMAKNFAILVKYMDPSKAQVQNELKRRHELNKK